MLHPEQLLKKLLLSETADSDCDWLIALEFLKILVVRGSR